MRIAIAAFTLESVSFLPQLSTVEDFRKTEVVGEEMLSRYRGTETVLGGFIRVLEREGVEIVPILSAGSGAAGPAEDAAFTHYVDRICADLAKAGELDGVLLHPHGAMVTPTRLDPDREMLERVRAVIGRKSRLVVALDYHANIDDQWMRLADAIFGYHYSPHVDTGATGERAAMCMLRTLRGEIAPVMAIAKPGVMVPSIFSATNMSPLSDIVGESVRLSQASQRFLDISVFAGFSYADVPNCGFSVLAVADGDREAAQATVSRLSERIHRERAALMHRDLVTDVATGVDRAIEIAARASKPVVILEHADRMKDSTYVLGELLRRGVRRAAVHYLLDPQAAATAIAAGIGATVKLSLGGHSSDRAGGPLAVTGKVLIAGGKEYRSTGPVMRGGLVRTGPAAVIDIDGIIVIVVTNPVTAIDTEPFLQFGLRPHDFDIIVLRSKTHFRAVYEELAEVILIVDTPDWGPADLTTLPYRHAPLGRTSRSSDANRLRPS